MCEHITYLKAISIDETSDAIINETVNVPRRSMKGLLLLFYESYAVGARDSKKMLNPEITEVKVVMNKIPHKVYSQGIKARVMFEEVLRRFEKDNRRIQQTFMLEIDSVFSSISEV